MNSSTTSLMPEETNNLLKNLEDLGMLDVVDAVKKNMAKREFNRKEQAVLKVHPHHITETSVIKNGKLTTVYQTRLGEKRPRCNRYSTLIEKLYDFYFANEEIKQESNIDFSFQNVFQLALDEKIRTESPKEKTVRDYHSSYKAFITDDFGSLDIRSITPSQVKEYIQTTTRRINPTKKRLYKLKGILNLAFRYASDQEHHLIQSNPVPSSNAAYKKNCSMTTIKPEDKAFSVKDVDLIRNHLTNRIPHMHYDVYAYAILFSSHTGVREGEIPSLKWSDVYANYIHIHSQQNDEIRDGKKVYYYNPTTKNEKGCSNDGRKIPMTDAVRGILEDLKVLQKKLGIESEWVFCKKDGSWIYTQQYYEALNKVCKKLGLKLSNNHAFRMSLNSYVFVPMGLSAPDRAKILGHSVTTNLNHYTFSKGDEYLSDMASIWDDFNEKNGLVPQKSTQYLKIVDISEKKKPPRSASSQGFQQKVL